MSNLPEPPPPLTLTVKKVLRVICAGIFIFSDIINSICIAVIFIHLGLTIPVLQPYAAYVTGYMFWTRTVFLACVFLVGCYWCCLRLVAPKQAGSSISEWVSKWQARSCETLIPSNGKLGRAVRTCHATAGVLNTYNGLYFCFRSWKEPEPKVYEFVMGVILLIWAAYSIQIAYVGRVSIKKGTRGENMTMGNNVSQPESDEVAPAGGYKDDNATTQ